MIRIDYRDGKKSKTKVFESQALALKLAHSIAKARSAKGYGSFGKDWDVTITDVDAELSIDMSDCLNEYGVENRSDI